MFVRCYFCLFLFFSSLLSSSLLLSPLSFSPFSCTIDSGGCVKEHVVHQNTSRSPKTLRSCHPFAYQSLTLLTGKVIVSQTTAIDFQPLSNQSPSHQLPDTSSDRLSNIKLTSRLPVRLPCQRLALGRPFYAVAESARG